MGIDLTKRLAIISWPLVLLIRATDKRHYKYTKENKMIIQGDCLEIMQNMDADNFGGVITDPPYCSGGATGSAKSQSTTKKYMTTKGISLINNPKSFLGDNKDSHSFMTWSAEWMRQAYRLCSDGSPILVFTDWRQLPTISDALQWAGWIWRGVIAWDKKNSMPHWGRFRQQAEFIVWGSKGDMSLRRNAPTLPGVFTYPVVQSVKRQHQTEKPLNLMRELVKIVEPGNRILDPFAGSGTTMLAALIEGYNCVGIELSEHYVEMTRKREEDWQINQSENN